MFLDSTREGRMLVSYLYYARRQIKKAITLLCQKDDLSAEDVQAIKELIEVIDRLQPQSISHLLSHRKEIHMQLKEKHALHEGND